MDWLGDIGGLVEALFFIGSMSLFAVTYNQFDSMMVSSLFQQSKQEGAGGGGHPVLDSSKTNFDLNLSKEANNRESDQA